MKQIKQLIQSPLFFPVVLLAGFFFYYLHYFNYIEMPTEDYIGNFKPFVLAILSGDLSSVNNKLLPAYPFLMTAVSLLVPNTFSDPIYMAAIILNFILLFPFLILAYWLYKRFLNQNFAFFAFLFLGINIYTLYSGMNAELEIFLCTMILLSIYLMSKKSWKALIPSAITAVIKWDALSLIPAYALHVFRRTKKLKYFILYGLLASIPFLVWMGFMLQQEGGNPNTYIEEITRRGSNVYKYPIDALITAFGFPRWLIMNIYHGRDMLSSILLCTIAVITLLALLLLLIYGIKTIIKLKDELITPLFIFTGGFVITHMIYQNTKDRYVIPIIWLIIMLAILGLKELMNNNKLPKMKKIFALNNSQVKFLVFFTIIGIFYIQSFLVLFEKHDIFLPLFAVFIQIVVFGFLRLKTSMALKKRLFVGLIAGIICFLNIAYSQDALNHFSLRRIEFKEAAIWFKENAPSNAKMLMSEAAVARYYTGIDTSRIVQTKNMESTDVPSLILELKDKKITYVFIDDFYISRLVLKDPNAIERKAMLMKELRDAAPNIQSMHLQETFETYTGPKAYMYTIDP